MYCELYRCKGRVINGRVYMYIGSHLISETVTQKRRMLNLPISRQERRPRSSLTRLLCRSCCQKRLVLKLSVIELRTKWEVNISHTRAVVSL